MFLNVCGLSMAERYPWSVILRMVFVGYLSRAVSWIQNAAKTVLYDGLESLQVTSVSS